MKNLKHHISDFLKEYWIGLLVVSLFTVIFFLPLIVRLNTYSPGGDAMFNAWVLSRNHHCMMQQNCDTYTNANIYYPNKDTMLYSETQISPSVITLPLRIITDNPIPIYNIVTIFSFFMAGVGMYLLAKRLSGGNEPISILTALVFEFAPLKIAAVYHLQNLSIFCLPFAIFFILRYKDTQQKRYLVGLFISLLYVFYSSWVQMVFVLVAVGVYVLGSFIFKLIDKKETVHICLIIALAVLCTAPLAKEYLRFSYEQGKPFSVSEQILYSSSVVDYVTPQKNTSLGEIYYYFRPLSNVNSYNPDTPVYHGFSLYVLTTTIVILMIITYRKNKNNKSKVKIKLESLQQTAIFSVIGIVGMIASLGPFLKIKGTHLYTVAGFATAIPLPYIFIDKFITQLSFIRAVGRWSVLLLFAMCCIIAIGFIYFNKLKISRKTKQILLTLLFLIVFIDIMPITPMQLSKNPHAFDVKIPQVYTFIKEDERVDNLVVIASDYDYDHDSGLVGFTRSEQTMWSGYHNKNIFNGYSGIEPKNYIRDIEDYNDFQSDDIKKLQKKKINYVLVDKQLCKNHPDLPSRVGALLKDKIYSDKRYDLYQL